MLDILNRLSRAPNLHISWDEEASDSLILGLNFVYLPRDSYFFFVRGFFSLKCQVAKQENCSPPTFLEDASMLNMFVKYVPCKASWYICAFSLVNVALGFPSLAPPPPPRDLTYSTWVKVHAGTSLLWGTCFYQTRHRGFFEKMAATHDICKVCKIYTTNNGYATKQ